MKTVYYDEDVPELNLLQNNKLVTYFYPRRDVCSWKLDEYGPFDRFTVWADISAKEECAADDMRLSRAFTKALGPWAESWPKEGTLCVNFIPKTILICSDFDMSCLYVPYPENASIAHYVNSFVHTRSKLTAFYPTCSSHDMKAVNKKFDEEIKLTNNNDFVQFSMRAESLLIYRTIADHDNNRLAVVGTQWKENFFDQYFDNFTRTHSDWRICKKVCPFCRFQTESNNLFSSKNARS